MAEAGGSSTISGVEYEQRVFVYYMAKMLIGDSKIVSITPQKTREIPALSSTEIDKTIIDDLVVEYSDSIEHFTIKQHSPSGRWKVSDLSKAGILKSFKLQYEETPDRRLKLISQSDSEILRELIRLAGVTTRIEIEDALSAELISEWDTLKEKLNYNDHDLLGLSKQIERSVLDLNNIVEHTNELLGSKFSSGHSLSDLLFNYAFQRAKPKLATRREDVVTFLRSKGVFETSKLSNSELKECLVTSSLSLEVAKSEFEFNHISRTETDVIMEWISQKRNWDSPNLSKILMVTGSAGMGKTTVLQDVLAKLESESIPVLGIKADRIKFKNLADLQECLNLPDKVGRVLASLGKDNEFSIVLIDQIDALSLTLSSNREQLDRYKELIALVYKIPQTLIVLSCRTFDLNNDLDLNQYRSNKQVEVVRFTREQVINVLQSEGVNYSALLAATIDLLRTPLYLTIYMKLSRNGMREEHRIVSANELYDQLWRRIILKEPVNPRLVELIDSVTTRMYSGQSIVTNKVYFENEYIRELDYLKSEGILQENGADISYFHQTFFDYSLARNFVRRGQSIAEEIQANVQGLYQRPRIKAVLEYLYEVDQKIFVKECVKILFSSDYRNHIKYLVLNIIGSLNGIHADIEDLGKKILSDANLRIPFLKSILSENWIIALTSYNDLDYSESSVLGSIYDLCLTNVPRFPEEVLSLIKKQQKQFTSDQIVQVLCRCSSVGSSLFRELYSEYKKSALEWEHNFSRIIDNARESKEFEFIAESLMSYYDDTSQYSIKTRDYMGHSWKKAIESIRTERPELGYNVSKKLLFDILEESKFEYQINPNIFLSHAYPDFCGYSEDETNRDHYILYKWLIEYLCLEIDNEKTEFSNKEIEELLNSSFYLSKCVALEVLILRAEVNSSFAYAELIKSEFKNDYSIDKYYDYLLGKLITVVFPYLKVSQQNELYDRCMKINEVFVWGNETERYRNQAPFYDRYRMVSRIPVNYLMADRNRKRQFQEFQRRFPEFKWSKPNRSNAIFSSGNIALPDKAYQSMNVDELEASFKMVSSKKRSWRPNVTVSGHTEKFRELVKESPNQYSKLVYKLITEIPKNDIDPVYGLNGLISLVENDSSNVDYQDLVAIALKKSRIFKSHSYELVKLVRVFVETNQVTELMFNFLIDRIEEEALVEKSRSLNYELDAIFKLRNQESFIERIFQVCEQIAIGKNENLKLSCSSSLALLNFSDKDRAQGIFIEIISSVNSVEIYQRVRSTIQYMLNVNHIPLLGFMSDAIESIEEESTKQWYGQLIAYLVINGFESVEPLVFKAEESAEYRSGILSFSIDTLKVIENDETRKLNAMRFVDSYLTEVDQGTYTNYQSLIRHISNENFYEWSGFIKKYIDSNVRDVNHRERTLNQKLYDLASFYPIECIEFCKLEIASKSFLNEKRVFYDGDRSVFDVLVKAYNSLSEVLHDEIREKTLDLIDESLRVMALKSNYSLTKTISTLSQNENN